MTTSEEQSRIALSIDEEQLELAAHFENGEIVIPVDDLRHLLTSYAIRGDNLRIGAGQLAVKSADISFASGICAINTTEQSVKVDGLTLELGKRPYGILELLSQHMDEPIDGRDITRYIWGNQYDSPMLRSPLMPNLSRIRQHLDKAHPGLGHKKTGVLHNVMPQNTPAKYILLHEWPAKIA